MRRRQCLRERIQSCKTFLERARQRVARAESVIARAIEQKEIYVKDVRRGFSPAHVSVPPDEQELQRQIDELRRERDLWRAAQTQIPKSLEGCGARGTAQLTVGSRDVLMDGSTRSVDGSLIEQSDAKRRVVQGARPVVAVHGGEPSVRTCYGLRGVRVGEASNPGPTQVQGARRRVVDSDDDVLTSLEHELT